MEEAYGFKHSNFMITWVCDNTIHTIFNSTMTIKELKKEIKDLPDKMEIVIVFFHRLFLSYRN